MPRSRSRKKRFFVREEDGIYPVFDDFFDDIDNRQDALAIALRTYAEVNEILCQESKTNEPLYIGNMKVLTGLQRSLDELDNRWPFLLVEMLSTHRRINGQVVAAC